MRILIRGTNWVGDAVMSVPAMRLIRASLPEAKISLLTGGWAEAVFDGNDFLDEIIVLNNDHRTIGGTFREAGRIRKKGFDATVIFPNSFHSALLAHLSGIPTRVGFGSGGRGLLLSHSIQTPQWKESRHESELYLHLVKSFLSSLGKEVKGIPLAESELSVSDSRKLQARKMLEDAGLKSDRPIVTLGTGSQNSRAKRWPSANYAELADSLVKELGANVVLLGSHAEKSVAVEVARLSGSKLIDFTGETGLSEAIALISISDLYIGNDMGLTHIAPAVGTETLAIFGPTNHIATSPLSERAQIIRKEVECSPCMLRDCPIDHRCMTGVTPRNVFEVAAAKLVQSGK